MISHILLFAVQASAAPAPTEQDVVVTARRMSEGQYAMKVHRKTGAVQCWITRSTGDPAIDWRICEIAKVCALVRPLKRKPVQECMRTKKQEFVASYVPAS